MMSYISVNINFIFITLCFICAIHLSTCGESKKDLPKKKLNPECMEVAKGIMQRQLFYITNCSDSMTFKNNKDRANKIHCILRCVAEKEGILTEGGLLERERIENYLKREILPSWLSRVTVMFNKCYDIGNGALDPTEELCKSYKPFMKCLLDLFTEVCKQV